MLRFELPLVRGNVSLDAAFADTIESKTSGLLMESSQGDLRLVHFDRMVNALTSGLNSLEEVEFDPVLNIEPVPDSAHESFVLSAGERFGFAGEQDGKALLFSVSESFGLPYTIASSGSRCQRPNRPPNTTPQDWYHYYPPNNRDGSKPNRCRLCGSWVP
jgi:hypothetical protein